MNQNTEHFVTPTFKADITPRDRSVSPVYKEANFVLEDIKKRKVARKLMQQIKKMFEDKADREHREQNQNKKKKIEKEKDDADEEEAVTIEVDPLEEAKLFTIEDIIQRRKEPENPLSIQELY